MANLSEEELEWHRHYEIHDKEFRRLIAAGIAEHDKKRRTQLLNAAIHSDDICRQAVKELARLKKERQFEGAAALPEELPSEAGKRSSLRIEPDILPPTSHKDQGVQPDSRSPQGSWGGARPDSSSGGSSTTSSSSTTTTITGSGSSSRQGTENGAGASSPARSSQQQASDNASLRNIHDGQRTHTQVNTPHNTPSGATDSSELVDAVVAETEAWLLVDSNASGSCGYTPSSSPASGLRRRWPWPMGGK